MDYHKSIELGRKKRFIRAALGFMVATLLISIYPAFGMDMGDSLIRDYPISLPIPKHRFEISLDYLRVDRSLDYFDIREVEDSDRDAAVARFGFEDMSGFKGMANYGLFSSTILHSSYSRREIEYGPGELEIHSLEIALKQNLNNRQYGSLPYLTLDLGFRWNNAKPPAEISASSWKDQSPYTRIIAGGIWGHVFANFFLEYGYSWIESEISPEYATEIKVVDIETANRHPIDASRNESHIRAGISLLIKFPYTAMSCLTYEYIKLLRDDAEGQPDDNHLLKADINYFLTENFIVNLGHEYYYRQFNGLVPSLFNQYTQHSHVQHYFSTHIGLTILFGVD